MATSLAIRMRAEPVRSVGFASIGAAYMGVGTAIDHPARQIFIQNLTDVSLMFSFDGVSDHFPLPANGFFLSDIMSNKSVSQAWYLSEGDRLYVREFSGLATTGAVYFSVFYGSV